MFTNGLIKNVEVNKDFATLTVVVPGDEFYKLTKYMEHGQAPVELRIDDGRSITIDQRKKIHAILLDISIFTGYPPPTTKEIMKMHLTSLDGSLHFSLADCSITRAREFINFLIEFCFQWNIPFRDTGMNMTDDMFAYFALCYKYKKCCICGRQGQDHHLDAIGMGSNRNNVYANELDAENEIIELCYIHHEEAHKKGVKRFKEIYKVFGIKKKYLSR